MMGQSQRCDGPRSVSQLIWSITPISNEGSDGNVAIFKKCMCNPRPPLHPLIYPLDMCRSAGYRRGNEKLGVGGCLIVAPAALGSRGWEA
jgi:hypothetical protein